MKKIEKNILSSFEGGTGGTGRKCMILGMSFGLQVVFMNALGVIGALASSYGAGCFDY